jgi:uncharacterized membrane protein
MGYWHDGLNGWDWAWMTLMMGVMWIPLVLIVIWAVSSLTRSRTDDRAPGQPPSSALEVAQLAYARGEVSRERYLQIVEDLKATSPERRG